MKTLVYFVRHGQSVGNRDQIFLGHTDMPLTELGREQARLAGEAIKKMGIVPDAVYASPLSRAYETAVLASGEPDPIPCDDLREIYAGVWEGMYYDDIIKTHNDDFSVWYTDLGNAKPTGGEAVAALSERVVNEVLRIAAENEGKTVLIGSHATPVRMLEAYARGLSISEAHTVPWAPNASLSAYLCEGKSVTPLFYGYDFYIGDIATTVAKKL